MNNSFVVVSVKGVNLSLFLESINHENLSVFELQKISKKEIRFKIKKSEFSKLKKSKIYKFYSVKVIREHGIKQITLRFFKYSGLVFGILLGFVCFWYSSLFISDIEILNDSIIHSCDNGENCIFVKKNQDKFKSYLEDIGVKTGEKVSKINALDIERKLVSKFEMLSACTIDITGTKLKITLHEAKLDSLHEKDTINIIAPENAKIISMNVSRGTPLVKAGDIVKKGQTLVLGEDGKSAIASIDVVLYYKFGKVYSENSVALVETGNVKSVSYLECKGLEILKPKDINAPFVYYETIKTSTLLNENLIVPINFITITFKEMQEVNQNIPIESKRQELESELRFEFEQAMGENLPTSYTSRFVLTKIADGVYLLDCYIECDTIISNKTHT